VAYGRTQDWKQWIDKHWNWSNQLYFKMHRRRREWSTSWMHQFQGLAIHYKFRKLSSYNFYVCSLLSKCMHSTPRYMYTTFSLLALLLTRVYLTMYNTCNPKLKNMSLLTERLTDEGDSLYLYI
jgi:hypothetical protein